MQHRRVIPAAESIANLRQAMVRQLLRKGHPKLPGSRDCTLDLGAPPAGPYAEVTAINERDYYAEANRGSDPVDEAEICRDGMTAYYQDHGWNRIDAHGGMVSATALNSFAGSIVVTDL